jgi:hypothetical protein
MPVVELVTVCKAAPRSQWIGLKIMGRLVKLAIPESESGILNVHEKRTGIPVAGTAPM